MSFSTKRGFTLIELLVVIAIIGLLASVVIASLNSARQKGREARRIADIKSIQLALEMFFDAAGSYPTSTTLGAANLTPNYMPGMPTDPSTNAAYTFQPLTSADAACVSTTNCPRYLLRATMETAHSVLNSDIDGTVGGIACDDAAFQFCMKQ